MPNEDSDDGDYDRLNQATHYEIEKLKAQMNVFAQHMQTMGEIKTEQQTKTNGKDRQKEIKAPGADFKA